MPTLTRHHLVYNDCCMRGWTTSHYRFLLLLELALWHLYNLRHVSTPKLFRLTNLYRLMLTD